MGDPTFALANRRSREISAVEATGVNKESAVNMVDTLHDFVRWMQKSGMVTIGAPIDSPDAVLVTNAGTPDATHVAVEIMELDEMIESFLREREKMSALALFHQELPLVNFGLDVFDHASYHHEWCVPGGLLQEIAANPKHGWCIPEGLLQEIAANPKRTFFYCPMEGGNDVAARRVWVNGIALRIDLVRVGGHGK